MHAFSAEEDGMARNLTGDIDVKDEPEVVSLEVFYLSYVLPVKN